MSRRVSLFLAAAVSTLFCAASVMSVPMMKSDDVKEARDQASKGAKVLEEIMRAPDKGIPQDLLDASECVAVFPSVIKAAFIFGGKGGKGLVSCRDTSTGAWGPPVFLKIGGGSFGLQIGAQATDLVLVGMNRRSAEMFKKDRFELGAEAEAAAGPVGRSTSASTDLPTIRSEFLSYSRSRGAFAGIALKGSVITRDKDLNTAAYGSGVSAEQILVGYSKPPSDITVFQQTLSRYSPTHQRK